MARYRGPYVHGTQAGYSMHFNRKEKPCVPCRRAHAAYKLAWKARRRRSNASAE